jgi:hypothetical protein
VHVFVVTVIVSNWVQSPSTKVKDDRIQIRAKKNVVHVEHEALQFISRNDIQIVIEANHLKMINKSIPIDISKNRFFITMYSIV